MTKKLIMGTNNEKILPQTRKIQFVNHRLTMLKKSYIKRSS